MLVPGPAPFALDQQVAVKTGELDLGLHDMWHLVTDRLNCRHCALLSTRLERYIHASLDRYAPIFHREEIIERYRLENNLKIFQKQKGPA